jgi:hypothetical protein
MNRSTIKIISIAFGAVVLTAAVVTYVNFEKSVPAADPQVKKNTPTSQGEKMAPGMDFDVWNSRIESAGLSGFRALMDEAMRISDPALRHLVVTRLVDKWLLEDARDFTKYFTSLEVEGDERALAVLADALQESLTKLDPERAASDDILVIVQRLISYLAGTDPGKALEWAKKWLLDDTLDSALVSIARGMAKGDIQQGLDVISQIKSPLRRSQALAYVGGVWAARDPNAALKWALGLTNVAERALTLNSVLAVLAQTDPSGAAEDLREQASQITERYAQQRAADLATMGLTEADLANDPESYNDLLASGGIPPVSSPDVELLAEAGTLIGLKLGSVSPAEAVDWALSLSGEYLQLKALSGVLDGWAKIDPVAALNYVNGNYPNNVDLVSSVFASWAASDPVAAAKGTQLIAESSYQEAALNVTIGKWAVSDVNAAADYVNSLPASQVTDSIKTTLVKAMSQSSPETAWTVAYGISSESAQYSALKNAFAVLVTKDVVNAAQILERDKAGLPAATSERLGEMVDAVVGN